MCTNVLVASIEHEVPHSDTKDHSGYGLSQWETTLMSSLIGWANTQNDPWIHHKQINGKTLSNTLRSRQDGRYREWVIKFNDLFRTTDSEILADIGHNSWWHMKHAQHAAEYFAPWHIMAYGMTMSQVLHTVSVASHQCNKPTHGTLAYKPEKSKEIVQFSHDSFYQFISQVYFIIRRAGLLWSQQDFECRWSVPLFKCLTVLEFSFILFDLCLLITFFNFIMNYVPIVTFWIFTYHKIWILSIMLRFIWSYWIIYFLACLEVSWWVVS